MSIARTGDTHIGDDTMKRPISEIKTKIRRYRALCMIFDSRITEKEKEETRELARYIGTWVQEVRPVVTAHKELIRENYNKTWADAFRLKYGI